MASAENRYTRYQDEITRIFQIVKIENKLHVSAVAVVLVLVFNIAVPGAGISYNSTTAPQQPGTKWITVEWFSGSGQITASQLLQNSGGYLF